MEILIYAMVTIDGHDGFGTKACFGVAWKNGYDDMERSLCLIMMSRLPEDVAAF